MKRFYGLLIVLLIGIATAGWMAFKEADERAESEASKAKESERLHKEACAELNELRSTIAAGGKVEL